jgi:hypothetical protein
MMPLEPNKLPDQDAHFVTTWLYDVSMLLACLRNHAHTGSSVDLAGAKERAKIVGDGLERFNHLLRELPTEAMRKIVPGDDWRDPEEVP